MRHKNKVTMLPSVGTPPVEEALDFIISLLVEERKNKEKNKSQKLEKQPDFI